jgi:hypothetical protein
MTYVFTILNLLLKISFLLEHEFSKAGPITAETFIAIVEAFIDKHLNRFSIFGSKCKLFDDTTHSYHDKLEQIYKIMYSDEVYELPNEKKCVFLPLNDKVLMPCSFAWKNAIVAEENSIFAKVIWHYAEVVSIDIFVNEDEWKNAIYNARSKFYLCEDEAKKAKDAFVESFDALEVEYKTFYTENRDTIPGLPC